MVEYLNFVAKIHCMPEYPWQCLDFLAQDTTRVWFLAAISISLTVCFRLPIALLAF